jgi:hypothetical protein
VVAGYENKNLGEHFRLNYCYRIRSTANLLNFIFSVFIMFKPRTNIETKTGDNERCIPGGSCNFIVKTTSRQALKPTHSSCLVGAVVSFHG